MKKTLLTTIAFACLTVFSSNAMAGAKTYSTQPNYNTYKKPSVEANKQETDNKYYVAIRGLVGTAPLNLHTTYYNTHFNSAMWQREKFMGVYDIDDFVTSGGEGAVGTYLTPNFRVEASYSYRKNTSSDSYLTFTKVGNLFNGVEDEYNFKQKLGLLNFYYDFDLGCIKPYVMAGAGAARNEYNIRERYFVASALTRAHRGKMAHSHFAWSVGAGIGIDIMQNLVFELGYRYTDAGQMKGYFRSEATSVNGAVSTGSTLARFKTHTQEVLAGIRFSF